MPKSGTALASWTRWCGATEAGGGLGCNSDWGIRRSSSWLPVNIAFAGITAVYFLRDFSVLWFYPLVCFQRHS